MNKRIKKVITGLALSVCIASATSGLMRLTDSSDAKAATSDFTVTNIEDIADSVAYGEDFYFKRGGHNLNTTQYGINQVVTTGEPTDWAIYTEKATETGRNLNRYDGNITMSTLGASAPGFMLKAAEHTVISFRFTYSRSFAYYFGMDQTSSSSWLTAPDGYYIWLRSDVLDADQNNLGNTTYVYEVNGDGTGANASKAPLTSRHTRNTDTTSASYPKTGDELIVTYGNYLKTVDEETQSWVYFKLQKEDGTIIQEIDVQDTNEYDTHKDGKSVNSMTFCIQTATGITTSDYINTAISGINNPIVTDGYDTTVEETYYAGQNASAALPTGYSLKNADEVLTVGTNSYDAYYTIEDYFGNVSQVPCTMTVTAEEAYTVTLKNTDGTTIKSVPVYGSSYTLETVTNAGRDFVGWINANGQLYPAGYGLAVSEDVELTLVEFALADGAAVRVANVNGNFGGLRFEIQVAETLQEIIFGDVINMYGAILPTDALVDNDFTEADIATATAKDSVTAITLENTTAKNGTLLAYFTLTNVLTTNYSRAFSGMAYVTVSYANDTTATICSEYTAADNSRTIMDVVYSAYYDAEQSYTQTQTSVLKAYLNSVVYVDLDNAKEVETISVLGENYVVYNEYSLSDVTENGFTLTTDVTYAASGDGSIHIPVFVLQNGVLSRATTTATAVDGGYTVTVSI